MKKIIKTLLITTSCLGLVACTQTTSTVPKEEYNTLTYNSKVVATSKAKAKIERVGKNAVNLTYEGKTYKFTKADLRDPTRDDRFKIYIQDGKRVKKADLKKGVKYEQFNLTLATGNHMKRVTQWQIGHYVDDVKGKVDNSVYKYGFLANGETPQKLPTKGTATYEGGFGWGSLRTKVKPWDSDRKDFWGDIKLDVNFDKSTLSGKLHELKTEDKNNNEIKLKGEIDISSGKITKNDFAADLKTNATLNTEMGLTESATGKLNGAFYGYYGSEMAGTIDMENKDYIGKFSFDGKVRD